MTQLKKHFNAVATVLIPRLELVVSSFLISNPGWQLAFHQAIGLYGYYMAMKQEDLNEFVDFLRDNPDIFRQEIVESVEFQNGFVQNLKTYLESRTQEKKNAVKNILINFTQSENKEEFELERLHTTLLQISTRGIRKLAFIQQVILPFKKASILKEIEEVKPQDPERWYITTSEREPIWKYISAWIYENYNPNSTKVKRESGVVNWEGKVPEHLWAKEKEITSEFLEVIEEYITLGIMRMQVTSEGFVASAATTYNFTSFGQSFIHYLESITQETSN